MAVYIISDLHLEHKNIIKYCSRPFTNVEEMNKRLIDNWNSVVDEKDIIYFLGDFGLGTKEQISQWARQLKGHKKLIKGNHDGRSKEFYQECGFEEVENMIFLFKNQTEAKYDIILSHEPLMILPENTVNIHGHIHDQQLDNKEFDNTKYFNASVENIDYKPILLIDVLNVKNW